MAPVRASRYRIKPNPTEAIPREAMQNIATRAHSSRLVSPMMPTPMKESLGKPYQQEEHKSRRGDQLYHQHADPHPNADAALHHQHPRQIKVAEGSWHTAYIHAAAQKFPVELFQISRGNQRKKQRQQHEGGGAYAGPDADQRLAGVGGMACPFFPVRLRRHRLRSRLTRLRHPIRDPEDLKDQTPEQSHPGSRKKPGGFSFWLLRPWAAGTGFPICRRNCRREVFHFHTCCNT